MAKTRLGSTYEALSGRIGNTVASNDQDGTSLRSYNPISKQPFTPKQVAVEANFTKATQAWVTLPGATADLWKAYALTQKVRNPLTGKMRTRQGRAVFVGLYAKLLQLNPASALPTVPAGAFAGDAIVFTAAATTGTITLTASGANSVGTTTEILLIRLPSPNAAVVRDGYRTAGFHAFATGSLSLPLSVSAGTWAVAVRFVNKATGQDTALVELPLQPVALSLEDGGAEGATEGLRKAA